MGPRFDTIIIGGGPAGSTLAALLARQGLSVLVLEKETFPRFHIGESLLPCSLPILQRLGIDLGDPAFRYKRGAEFFDEQTGDYALYPFADALPSSNPGYAYHVLRSSFDAALLERARRSGAVVHEGERVREADIDPGSVHVVSDRGRYTGRYLVDATGQDAFFARRRRATQPIDEFGRVAVLTHFEDLTDAAVEALGDEGDVKVLMRSDGWSWLIPLAERRLSVGTVTRRRGVKPSFLDETIGASPLMSRITGGARRLGTRVERNFSYKNTSPSGQRYACIGDAACFLDPIFSSGIALAMAGADALTSVLVPALERGQEAGAELCIPLEEHMDRAYACVSLLIHSFYHTHFVRNLFFAKSPDPQMRAGLISILAGDVWRDDNGFQNLLLGSKRRHAWQWQLARQ